MIQRSSFLPLLSQTWAQLKFLIYCVILASKQGIRTRETVVHVFILTLQYCRHFTVSAATAAATTTITTTISTTTATMSMLTSTTLHCRSQWPRGLRRGSAVVRLLGLWVRIPPGAWMPLSCEWFVLSSIGLWDRLITRPEESYRTLCV